jgi:MYXO-CTERM domain-containing protein
VPLKSGGCGCNGAPGAPTWPAWMLLGLVGLRRRSTRPRRHSA